jgi:hypothetical protein
MAGRADTANTLSISLGFPGISTLKDNFKTPEHHTCAMGIFHYAILGGDFYLQVSFDAGYWINNYLAQF